MMSSYASLKLYDWQNKIKEHEGNITIRGGRQTGKSEAVGERIKKIAEKFAGCRILIIAASERQENYLYEKVKGRFKKKDFEGRVTLTKAKLQNGTTIFKFPVGKTGIYIEGLSSVDFLFADEAIHINKNVWNSIIPMLAEPKARGLGWITLLSATRGKPEGFFYDSFRRKDFEKVQIKAEDCPHISKEFLEEEKKRLGELMYGVIYNGDFSEESYKYFPSEIIERAIKIKFFKKEDIKNDFEYYLGIDPARFGKSKSAFAVAELKKEKIKIVLVDELEKSSLIEQAKKTEYLNSLFNFKKIFIDSGGVGAGLIDILGENKKIKRKLRELNNAAVGREERILKEDLYSNLLRLLESEKLEIITEAAEGLKKVEFEEDEKIKGTDISEAITRACWATKEKGYKLKVF